jgi:hypothetical protein
VSWHLRSVWLGSATQPADFRADQNLSGSWYRVKGGDACQKAQWIKG